MVNSQNQPTASNEAPPTKKPLFQLFDELIKNNLVLADKIKSQAQTRIERDNLPASVFKVTKYGIKILYRLPNGSPYNFTNQKIEQSRANRKTVGIDTVLEYQFYRYRISDALIELSGFEGKYISLSKFLTGESNLPFFTDAAINAYNAYKQGGTIYFTEGEIKAAIMSLNGLEAIGFGGIGMFALNDVLIEYLLQRKPDNIVLIYDADFKKLGNKYKYARPTAFFDSAARFISELKQLFQREDRLPNFNICTGKNELDGKGVDDVLMAHQDTAVTALKSLQINNLFRIEQINANNIFRSCTGFFDIMADSRKYTDRIFQGNEGEYLADIVNRYGIEFSDFRNKTIISPVGSGKSTLIRSMVAHERTVVAVPTNALQKDFEREALKHGIDCYLFNSDKYVKDVKADADNLQANNKLIGNLDKEIIKKQFIIVTYKSFHHLVSVLGKNINQYILAVDECHNFTSAAAHDYMHDNLSSILHNVKKFKSYTLFTATDLPVFASELQLEKWIFTIPTKIQKKIQFFDKGKNQYSTAAQIAAATAKNGNLPLIVLNNKGKGLSKLKRALNPYKSDYQVFNADTKEKNHHIELLSTGKIKTDVMVSTSVIKEGVNIYNTIEHVVLISVASPGTPPMHAAEIEQFAARFRLAKSVTVIVLVDKESIKLDFTLSFANDANIGRQNAISYCNDNNLYEPHEREFLGLGDSKILQREAVTFNDIKNEWQFCPLLLANNVFVNESKIQRINPFLLLRYLEKYGWRCNDSTDTEILIRSTEKLEYQESEQPGDEPLSNEELFIQAINSLETNEPITTAETAAETSENPFYSLFLDVLKAVDCISRNNNMDAAKLALEILKETEGKTDKVNTLKRRLNFKWFLANLMAKKKTIGTDKLKKTVNNIVNEFTAADGLTAHQVRDMYIKTVSKTKIADNRDLTVLRNDRILNNLTRFLDYSYVKEKRAGKTVKIYYFTVVDWI